MAIIYDPQNNEIKALQTLRSWQGKRVLELGCGDGRLTERLAAIGAIIDAYEPNEAHIAAAKAKLPATYADVVNYQIGRAEDVSAEAGPYDFALFSWSL